MMMRRFSWTSLAVVVIAWGGLRDWEALAGSPAEDGPAPRSGLFPRSPEESAGAARVEPGFEVGLFAADPHLASPVAMTFDADGDVYVAEMLDYPIIRTPGMFGPFPEGQVRLLRTDGRGEVVRSSVFATALSAPTSLVPFEGGVLVAAAPDILFLKDTDGDGHADVRKVILSGFDASQDLYRVNSLLRGNDGWIYARGVGDTPIHWGDDPGGPALSTGGMSFRFRVRERKFEAVSGLSSCFGLTMDDWGHLFFSNSANHVYQVVLPNRYLGRNPYLASPPVFREISDHGGVAQVSRISEPPPWRVERSEIWEKTGQTKKYFGKIEPRQDYMTAVCGPLVYRESAFPAEFRGNYFVCEAVSNLVHRDVLKSRGPLYTASRGSEGREFFASADNWSSPVYLDAGPDGALYVVDMYRQVIEHAGPDGGRDVPNVPLKVLQKYGLRAGSTMGRIYRVAPSGGPRAPKPGLGRATPGELVGAHGSPDAWWRTSAQRLILEKPEGVDVGAIADIARANPHAAARLQALWTLEALGKLDDSLVAGALRDEAAGVRENALKMAEGRFERAPGLAKAALAMVDDPDPTVRFQLALTLGEVPSASRVAALEALLARGADDPYLRVAVLSSAGDHPLEIFRGAAGLEGVRGVDAFLAESARVIGARLDKGEIAELLDSIARLPAPGASAALRGLAQGIERRGKGKLDIPLAGEALSKLRSSTASDVRSAAGAVGGLIRALTDGERKALLAGAADAALDEARAGEERERAIESLGSIDSGEVVATLVELLRPQTPERLQLAALGALGGQSGPEVVRVLADSWAGLTPASRAKAAEAALERKGRIGPLLEAILSGKIPADAFDPTQRARLLGATDESIAEAAKAAFGPASRGGDPGPFERFKAALDLEGDGARGASTFKQRCIACHKAGGEGAEVGPDLASVKNRPREQVLRDILYPSLAFAPQYHQYVVATTDGRLVTGLIVASNASGFTIRKQGGEEVSLLRKDVEEMRDTQISLMPENLLDGLGPQVVADLLEYVRRSR